MDTWRVTRESDGVVTSFSEAYFSAGLRLSVEVWHALPIVEISQLREIDLFPGKGDSITCAATDYSLHATAVHFLTYGILRT